MEKDNLKTPLKNGVLVMVEPKYRRSEYIKALDVVIDNETHKTLGIYLNEQEAKIAKLSQDLLEVNNKINQLIEVIKTLNERSVK